MKEQFFNINNNIIIFYQINNYNIDIQQNKIIISLDLLIDNKQNITYYSIIKNNINEINYILFPFYNNIINLKLITCYYNDNNFTIKGEIL